jgi:hypothetical protein
MSNTRVQCWMPESLVSHFRCLCLFSFFEVETARPAIVLTMKVAISFFVLSAAMSAGVASAQTLCSKYTVALFKNNTGTNQFALLMALIDLTGAGNATLKVPGLLAPEGGLAGFFNGAKATTNRGNKPVSINFLDGSAASTTFFAHLYQFFGAILGCNAPGFPAYTGDTDMNRVHKFMNITKAQNDFFISQVGAAATALGVIPDDVKTIANLLDKVFNTRCPPLLTAADPVPSFLVGTNPSVCTDIATCPLAMPNNTCSVVTPAAPKRCGLLGLSLLCLNGCGFFGRLLGLCKN